MLNNLLLADAGQTSSIIWLVVLIGLIVVMLVLPSVSQKKRVQAYEEMKSRLRAGDKVQTIGGIVGKVLKIKEANGVQTIIIETGDKNNKTVIEFDINAIAGVVEGLNNPNQDAPQVIEKEDETEAEEFDVSFDAEEQPAEEKTQNKSKSKKK